MTTHMPPIPPDNQSNKRPKQNADAAKGSSEKDAGGNTAEQGRRPVT